MLIPMKDGKPIPKEDFDKLPQEEREKMEERGRFLGQKLDEVKRGKNDEKVDVYLRIGGGRPSG